MTSIQAIDSQSVLDILEVGYVVQDGAGTIVEANAAAHEMFGSGLSVLQPGATSTGTGVVCISADGQPMPQGDRPAMVTLRTGRPVHGLVMGLRTRGTTRWLRVDCGVLARDAAGQPSTVATLLVEITGEALPMDASAAPLTSTSTALEEGGPGVAGSRHHADERCRLVAGRSSDMLSAHDADGRFLYVSTAAQECLGYPREELVGRRVHDLVHPDDAPRMRAAQAELLAGHGTTATYRVRRADGSWVQLEATSRPLVDRRGRILEVQTASRHVTVG